MYELSAGMDGTGLLNPDIESKHRAKKWEQGKIEPLLTRTQKENWRIHPAWVERYVFIPIWEVCT